MNHMLYLYSRRILIWSALVLPCGIAVAGNPCSPYGMNMHTHTNEVVYDRAAEAGVEWVRLEASRDTIEEQQFCYLYGTCNWDNLEDAVNAACARGLSIYMTIAYTPAWDPHVQECSYCQQQMQQNPNYNGYRHHSPSDFSRWGDFVAAVVNKFKDRVKYYGVWNEPDSTDSLVCNNEDPIFDGDHGECEQLVYIKMLEGASEAIRSACPDCKVVAPCTSDQEGGLEYMCDIVSFSGVLERIDVIAQNIYDDWEDYVGWEETFLTEYAEMKALLGEADIWDQRPVWITETGWPTVYKGKGIYTEDDEGLLQDQAARYTSFLGDFLKLMQTDECLDRIFFYDIANDCRGGAIQNGQGVLKCLEPIEPPDPPDPPAVPVPAQPKPAYYALQDFISAHPFFPGECDPATPPGEPDP